MTDEPPYDIEINAADGLGAVNSDRIAEAIRHTLSRHKLPSCRISVALVSDPIIANLHQQFMNVDGPTDVLTFDLGDGDATRVEGEIIISYDTAAREGAARDLSIDQELMLYAVHGTLHLLGHDDADPDDARRMHELEDEILTELGAGPVFKVAPQ